MIGAPLTLTIAPSGDETDEHPAQGFSVTGNGITRFVGPSTKAFDAFQQVCFDLAIRNIIDAGERA